MKKMLTVLLMGLWFITSLAYSAAINSPVGKWITLDYKTHKAMGIVEITENNGSLEGKIMKGFGVDPLKYCHHCKGNLKDAPVIGLTFMWGFLPHGNNTWTKGHILDPHDGEIYRGTMKLSNDGKKLQLRGYWGIFYQTETWIRADNS